MKDASTKGAVFDKESLPIPTDPAPSVVYRFFRFLFTVILHIFFRDITVVGLENIPMDGNVILSGNHFNQFVDALLLVVVCPRPISFVAAEKTMRRKFLGWLSRKLRAIPVIRPQDRAKRGKGTITIRDTKIVGTDTQFTEEVELGGGILIATSELPLRVKQILSDTEILLDETMDKPHENIPYKCLPKIDQSKVFEAVWKFLGYKGCIGVFPEGGSHDRPELLPLKAGIAIMSLGFVSKYQEDSIVVPCGFTYFEGHRFRSQVVVEFGLPLRFSPHDDLAKTYNSNKKKAITDFLNEIRLGMESVTLTASSYVDIKAFQLARRLYEAEANVNIEKADRALLLRQISHVFKNHNDIRVQSLKNRLVEFQKKLASYGLDQSQVEHFSKSYAHAVPMILHRIFTIFITFLLAIPGLICAAPIAVACEVLSAREMRRAKANSVVKLEGKDVVASYKLIVSFFVTPLLYMLYISMSVAIAVGNVSTWEYIWILPIIISIGFPIVAYMSVKLTERAMRYLKSLPALLLALNPRAKSRRLELLMIQENLIEDIMKLLRVARNSKLHYTRSPNRGNVTQVAPMPSSPPSPPHAVIIRR